MEQVRISRDVKGHLRPGTLEIVLGGTSRDVKGHLRPGTLDIVLGGTRQDIPGCEGTFETWDFGHCTR